MSEVIIAPKAYIKMIFHAGLLQLFIKLTKTFDYNWITIRLQ